MIGGRGTERGYAMIYEEIPVRAEGSADYARLQVYIQDTPHDGSLKVKKRPLILICPGGGYVRTSYREGEPTALHFLSKGYHACVLRYSVAPVHFPTQVLEVGKAMQIIRENAAKWKVDMDRIVVQGSSAGGHLAASYGVFWEHGLLVSRLKTGEEALRPRGIMLSYPVITADPEYAHRESFEMLLGEAYEAMADEVSLEKRVTKSVPPCFIWHTMEDETVPVENSLLFAMALRKEQIPAELHIFPEGAHGLSLASPVVERENGEGVQAECARWIELADAWLERLFA